MNGKIVLNERTFYTSVSYINIGTHTYHQLFTWARSKVVQSQQSGSVYERSGISQRRPLFTTTGGSLVATAECHRAINKNFALRFNVTYFANSLVYSDTIPSLPYTACSRYSKLITYDPAKGWRQQERAPFTCHNRQKLKKTLCVFCESAHGSRT